MEEQISSFPWRREGSGHSASPYLRRSPQSADTSQQQLIVPKPFATCTYPPSIEGPHNNLRVRWNMRALWRKACDRDKRRRRRRRAVDSKCDWRCEVSLGRNPSGKAHDSLCTEADRCRRITDDKSVTCVHCFNRCAVWTWLRESADMAHSIIKPKPLHGSKIESNLRRKEKSAWWLPKNVGKRLYITNSHLPTMTAIAATTDKHLPPITKIGRAHV